MSKAKHFNFKTVEVYYADGSLYKEFSSVTAAAEHFNTRVGRISTYTATPDKLHKMGEGKYRFVSKGRTTNNKAGRINTEKETEDQIRRRLGLNPYGEWRNDEWLNAMFERVNKQLYPDGYDNHEMFLRQKAMDRTRKVRKGEEKTKYADNIDYIN